jgi:Na+-driven multidrug efflux pump
MSFLIVAPSYLFNSLVNGWSSAFNAMGKPQMSVYMTLIKMIALLIPAVMIGAKLGGVMGIFAALSLVNIATGLGFHLWSWRVFKAAQGSLALKTP